MTTNTDLLAYYESGSTAAQPDDAARADDLLMLQVRVQELLQDHDVLELACGDGFWTEQIAQSARTVHAVDLSAARLEQAGSRLTWPDTVTFSEEDAVTLPFEPNYTACFIGRWWQHFPRELQRDWLERLSEGLGQNALLVIVDENPTDDEEDIPIARTDAEGNTFKIFTSPAGERFEILKNTPTDSALRKRFSAVSRELKIVRFAHYYLLSCRLKG